MLALTLSLCAALAPPPDAAEEVAAILAEYDAAHAAWYERYLEAQGSAAVMKEMPDPKPFAVRLLDAVEDEPTSAAAFRACRWTLEEVRFGGQVPRAVAHLADHFAEHPEIGELLPGIDGGRQPNDQLLEAVLERHADDATAGRACYQLGSGLLRALDAPGLDPDERARRARDAEHFLRLCGSERFADLPLEGRRTTIGARAARDLFELEHLQPGQPAPDIEAEDLDGVVFRLSDYRGKVVMLDFWGHW